MKFLSKHLLTGLVTVLPVLLTSYLLYWMALSSERVLGSWIRAVLPEAVYWPGMGVAAAVLGLLLVGLLMNAYVVQRIFGLGEALLYKVPIIKTVYGSISDFFTYFSPQKHRELNQVVAVTLGENLKFMGFLTRSETDGLPEELRENDNVLVYLPMSYMIGGYTVAVPRSAVQAMDMSMEQAMRFTLTAGVTGDPGGSPPGRAPPGNAQGAGKAGN
jgi:uncharacterized membrane protein